MDALSISLRRSIESYAQKLLDSSELGQVARAGGLTPRAVAYYLTNLRYLFMHSQRNLALAADRSEQHGDPVLAAYFRRKVIEETGHDLWASDDLSRIPDDSKQGLQPSPQIVALVALQRDVIERHPACFVVYSLWAEYFTVLVGDEWLAALEACGFTRDRVSAIDKHLEADREHAARGLSEVDTLWHGEPAYQDMLNVVDEAAAIFEAFCDDVCAQARHAA